MPLSSIQKKFGVKFKDEDLLVTALTHSSFVHEHQLKMSESNERMEFLGDAVLNLSVAEMLIRAFPEEAEGKLSKRRAALVNQKSLSKLAMDLGVGEALRLGKGEEKTGGRTKESLLGDAFEALLGALYLDQGLQAVQKRLAEIFEPLIVGSEKLEVSQDYKTQLQEQLQKLHRRSPRYFLESQSGPDHAKTFQVRVEFKGELLAKGSGRSKREAEQRAAQSALDHFAESKKEKTKKVSS